MASHATHSETSRVQRSDRDRVADLLSRYPEVSEKEEREILTFLRTGRHLDIGLLTSDQQLRRKLDAFVEKHKAHFRVAAGETVAVSAGIVALLLLFWLIWEAFS